MYQPKTRSVLLWDCTGEGTWQLLMQPHDGRAINVVTAHTKELQGRTTSALHHTDVGLARSYNCAAITASSKYLFSSS